MQIFPQQTTHISGNEAPVVVARPKRFQLAVTFDLRGAEWEFVNKLHAVYRFHEYWPPGMLCHITGETADGVISVGVWTDEHDEQAFFRDVAVKVITQALQDFGVPAGDFGAMDFQPVSRHVDNLIVGPLLGDFQDIGPDLDASAVFRLGTQPVSLDCTFPQAHPNELCDAERQLGLHREAPEGLLMLLDERDEEGRPKQSQIWRSRGEALDYWKRSFLPALIDVGGATTARPPRPVARDLKRISVGSSELDKAWN